MENFAKSREYGTQAAFVPPYLPPQPGSSQSTGAGNNFRQTNTDDLPKAQITEPQRYGETILTNPVTLVAANAVVLQQPATTRVFLMIQNLDAAADMWINFGANAAVNRGFKLGPGGIAFYDSFVPQDEINVFSVAAVTYALHYANKAL